MGPVEGVLGDGDQGVGVALGSGTPSPVGQCWVLVGSGGEGLFDELAVDPGELSPQFVGGLIQGGLDREEPTGEQVLFG